MRLKFLPHRRRGAQIAETEDYKAMGYPDQRKIVGDSRGNLYVTYRRKYRLRGLHRYHIFVAKSTDQGAAWVVLNNGTPVERVGDYTQRVAAIAVGADDALHLAWYGNDAGNTGDNQRQIKYARSADGGANWSSWVNVAEVPGYAGQRLWQEHPAVYAQGAGNVYIVWQGMDAGYSGASQVKFARSTDGGISWGSWRNVSPANGNRSRPTLVATNDGSRLHILAYGDMGGTQQIVWTTSDDGGDSWAPWSAIAASAVDQRHVSVVVGGDALHAVWRQHDRSGKAQVHYASYAGGAWSPAALVGANSAAYQTFPSISITPGGTLWAAWTETASPSSYPADDPQDGQVCYASKPAGGVWSAPARLAARGDKSIYASLRWDRHIGDERVDLVWLENESEQKQHIYHIVLGKRPPD